MSIGDFDPSRHYAACEAVAGACRAILDGRTDLAPLDVALPDLSASCAAAARSLAAEGEEPFCNPHYLELLRTAGERLEVLRQGAGAGPACREILALASTLRDPWATGELLPFVD